MLLDLWKSIMLKSSRKKLIVSGCSYTDNWWTREHGVRVWPEILAEKLDMDCINLGQCGRGNEYIFQTIIDEVQQHRNIGLVIPMWSEWNRIDLPKYTRSRKTGRGYSWYTIRTGIGLWPENKSEFSRKPTGWLAQTLEEMTNLFYKKDMYGAQVCIERSMRFFYLFQELMESKKLNYIQSSAVYPIPLDMLENDDKGWRDKDFIRTVFESIYLDEINHKKFVGWPVLSQLGGDTMDEMLWRLTPESDIKDGVGTKYTMSINDSHPNGAGHTLIAERLYDEYQKIYL